ncbi:MAG TPA: hypothetical protein VKC61_24290 [Pyrinomonadaceae bacterium]|nr:hypothetical protein [Pyrinomonadaceae bacterium]
MAPVFILLLASITHGGPRKHADSQHLEDRLLRAAIVRAVGGSEDELKYVPKRLDLNGDGRKELLVWVPTIELGGTSGYPLLVFSRDRNGYRPLWSFDQAWTPLIVLSTSHHGWHDLAFQMGGSGDAMHYVLVRHNGESYSGNFQSIKVSRLRGRWLIGKGWNMSTMGPLPQ